ncbi:uncharacterized protein LOC118419353 [Branchiostoma floridae]|uniref:Uncharacterized protein LOC118419353 n=1 Tax=Branchiostoma floridae TaxID=7739 RepID=A0A9J7LH30_BRAFL|nr:uncharacterized protein LOC118419353 [Branchiostoma floridae]
MGSGPSTPPKKQIVNKFHDVTQDKVREAKERQIQKQERQKKEKEERCKRLKQDRNKKRQELRNYRFGNIHGQHYFAGLDIRDMQEGGLRIGLFGPAGSGKSSFINTCERAMKQGLRRGNADIQTAYGEGTIVLQEYLDDIDNDFCLVDTRGFFQHNIDELTALADIVHGRIRPGQEVKFGRSADKEEIEEYFPNWLHAIIIVLSATDPRLQDGHTHRNNLKIVRDFMRRRVVTVITHHDRIHESQEEDILAKASAATGSALDHIVFVANYHIDKKETDYNTEMGALEVMKSALHVAERYVKMHKLQELADREDETIGDNAETACGEDQ